MITPARVYVIHDGGLLKWHARVVDFVWSSSQTLGAKWQNDFSISHWMTSLLSR